MYIFICLRDVHIHRAIFLKSQRGLHPDRHGETGHPGHAGDSRSAACCTQWSPANLAASDWCPGSGDDQDVLEGNGQRGERCRVFPLFFPAFWALNVGCGGHHVSFLWVSYTQVDSWVISSMIWDEIWVIYGLQTMDPIHGPHPSRLNSQRCAFEHPQCGKPNFINHPQVITSHGCTSLPSPVMVLGHFPIGAIFRCLRLYPRNIDTGRGLATRKVSWISLW